MKTLKILMLLFISLQIKNTLSCQEISKVKIITVSPDYSTDKELKSDTTIILGYYYQGFYLFRQYIRHIINRIGLRTGTKITKDTVILRNFFFGQDSTTGILFYSDEAGYDIRPAANYRVQIVQGDTKDILNQPLKKNMNSLGHIKIDSICGNDGIIMQDVFEVNEGDGRTKYITKWVFDYAKEDISRHFSIASDIDELKKWKLKKFTIIRPRIWLPDSKIWFKGGVESTEIEKIIDFDENMVKMIFEKFEKLLINKMD